jgi:hypothetical protein
MILQYLLLIPEYMQERQTLLSELGAKYVGSVAYLLSAMLTEVPRAILQTLLLMFIVYSIHPLNPSVVNIFYCLTCTMLGLSAWQALISLCAVATNINTVAYSMLFLVLSSGTMFGGLLVRYSKLPALLRPFYYVSVAAVTQRALLSNDLRCCYLTATCNSIAHDLHLSPDYTESSDAIDTWYSQLGASITAMGSLLVRTITVHFASSASPTLHTNVTDYHGSVANSSDVLWDSFGTSSSTFCPPGLEFTGDGSDLGNLGRFYLLALDMQREHPLVAVLFLLLTTLLFRLAAMGILSYRVASKDRLTEGPDPLSTK